MWACELSGGQWHKRVYPRSSHPDRLYRWATVEVGWIAYVLKAA